MARQNLSESELDDLIECSICTEVFADPRVLPCIHTFCLKCLLNYGKDRQPGDTVPCPLCRKQFTIPDDGLAGTQKNFLMEKLLHARKLPAEKIRQHTPCDSCSNDEAKANTETATMHCVQCQQNYCNQCSRSHRMMKVSADHVQLVIGKLLQKEEIMTKPPSTTCEVHEGEEVKVFCLQCKLAICMMCVIKSHKNHDHCDIEEVSAYFHSQAVSDSDKVTKSLKKFGELLSCFEKEKNDLISHLADIESDINKAADKLIDSVQRGRRKLLSEVESIRQKRAKQLATLKEQVEQHMAALESFKRYSETLLSTGTSCDVTRSATSLHNRAIELTMFDLLGHVICSLPPVTTLKFTSSSLVNREAGCLIGKISQDDSDEQPSAVPTVTHVIPKGNHVGGVTSLGDDVFVVREDVPHVEVYDAVTFTLRRPLAVPGLGSSPIGVAVCAVNKCLYVPDIDNNVVHRVELSGSNAVMKWSVARRPVGVSVNSAQNVLVVSQDERKLQEFTTHGSLVRNIQLQSGIQCPRCVVQLSADKFLIDENGSLHRICVLDGVGAIVHSCGGRPGSDLSMMNNPAGLAVDKYGSVLVADQNNNRLLVLGRSLISAREMSVSVDGGLNSPRSLCYDESRRRLYVGEWEGRRVIVIDNLEDFSTLSV